MNSQVHKRSGQLRVQGSRIESRVSIQGATPTDGEALRGIFISLAVPAIKDGTTTAAAISAGLAAVFAAALPLNLGLITAALVGVTGGLVAETVAERRRR